MTVQKGCEPCAAAVGGEQAAIEDWQIKRDGTERGVVEIKAG